MKATIESTPFIVEIAGIKTRLWKGRSEAGTEFYVMVAMVAVPDSAPDMDQFARELQEVHFNAQGNFSLN
jgi:hypothetical protein